MADTILSYQRQVVGPATTAPDTQGLKASVSATNRFLENLDQFSGAMGTLAAKYNQAIETRITRDAKTEVSKMFRERAFAVQSDTKLAQADGLLDRESQWAQKTKGEFAKKYSQLQPEVLETLWASEEDQYLTRMGAYQLSEQAKADKQSRIASIDEARNKLVDYEVGDLTGLSEYMAKIRETLPGRDGDAVKAADQGITDQVKIWARRDAKATIKWFNENRESLEQQFGSEIVKVSDAIKTAEDHVRAEASYQEAQAAKAERMQRKAQEQYDKRVAKEHFTQIYKGGFDYTKVIDDPNMSVETKKMLLSTFEHVGRETFNAEADQKGAFYVDKAHTQEWTDELESSLQQDAAKGLIKPGQLNTIRNIIEERDKAWKTEKGTILKAASEYLKTAIAPTKGTLMPTDPEAESRYLKMQATIAKMVSEKDVVTLTKELDINDPGSFINRFIEVNRTTSRTPRTALGGITLGWTPKIPGAAPAAPAAPTRLPNETPAEYLKRTGK